MTRPVAGVGIAKSESPHADELPGSMALPMSFRHTRRRALTCINVATSTLAFLPETFRKNHGKGIHEAASGSTSEINRFAAS